MKILLVTILFIAPINSMFGPGPDGRAGAHLLYHAPSHALLLFDGFQVDYSEQATNIIWKWDGRSWTSINAEGPDGRSLTAASINPTTNSVIDFGGIGQRAYDDKKADIWSFNGNAWNQLSVNSIGTRDHHKIIFADHLSAFVLYGGLGADRQYDTTTWIIRDDNFTRLSIKGPGLRYHFGMTYDRHRKRVVLYGGGKDVQREQLWEFDGQQWHQVNAPQPGRRLRHNLVYSDDLKMSVLHGGSGGDDPASTWGWDGSKWHRIACGGPAADMQALGYDPVRKVVVAFGGYDDNEYLTSSLWELKDNKWKMVTDNGTWQLIGNKYVKVKQ